MREAVVIGIDPNSHKLSLVWNRPGNKKAFFKNIELVKGDPVLATGIAGREIDDFFRAMAFDHKRTFVYMERPVMGIGGPGATIPQSFVQGAVIAACFKYNIPLRLVNNQSWKKRVLGSGGIDKPEVARRMTELWPEFVARLPKVNARQWKDGPNGLPDQDLVDAGAIHLFGKANVSLRRAISRRRS
jgi:Holliday junction resolvasome RuvABC endonuclease subunit